MTITIRKDYVNMCLYIIANDRLKQAYAGISVHFPTRKSIHKSSGNPQRTAEIANEPDTVFTQVTEYMPEFQAHM